MKVSNSFWAERLAGKLPEALAREIDIFETEIALRKQGKIDERLFAETRLRRGTYGQRYDNGQRYDGTKFVWGLNRRASAAHNWAARSRSSSATISFGLCM